MSSYKSGTFFQKTSSSATGLKKNEPCCIYAFFIFLIDSKETTAQIGMPGENSNLSGEQLGNKINIYPNPVSNNLSVDIDVATSDPTIYNIKLVTTADLIVREITSSGPSWQGSAGNLQPGTYILGVFNQDTQNLIGESKFVKLQ